MEHSTTYKKLLYEHEVLWARYEIRDHHLKKIGEKIYDDIGQVLSLVRIQLCRTSCNPDGADERATQSGELVGSAIRGLRAMHRSFYPETGLRETGLLKTLAHELELSGIRTAEDIITVQGAPRDLEGETQLIVFRMLQEILSAIPESGKEKTVSIRVAYEKDTVCFSIEYSGNLPEWNHPVKTEATPATRLSLPERAALIEGHLSVESTEAGRLHVLLTVPFKTSVYEQ